MDLLSMFPTKRTPITTVHFTPRNLCLVAGPYLSTTPVAPHIPVANPFCAVIPWGSTIWAAQPLSSCCEDILKRNLLEGALASKTKGTLVHSLMVSSFIPFSHIYWTDMIAVSMDL